MTYCNRAIEVFNRLYVWFHHQAKTPTPLPAWRAVAVQSEWSCVISAYQEHAPVIYYHQNGTVLGHVGCVEWSSVGRQIIQSYCAYETKLAFQSQTRNAVKLDMEQHRPLAYTNKRWYSSIKPNNINIEESIASLISLQFRLNTLI